MKKYLIVLALFIMLLGVTGCKNNKYALEFKEEYESLNGTTNKSGKEHRTISISKDNPFHKVEQKDIVKMIEDKETFYLYVGDPLCPWCRSVLEKSIEVAKENKVKEIYYIDIWDDDGNEILRDKYELKDGTLVKTVNGTEEYKKLLEYFDSVLSNYTVSDNDGNKIETGEKRIYAPNFFYIENGKVIKLVEGISDKQKDSREELTKEILDDEQKIFEEFFNN